MLILLAILVVAGTALADHHDAKNDSSLKEHKDFRYYGPPAPLNYDGTVDDTPEVKHAKAFHFSALAHAGYGEPIYVSAPAYSFSGYNQYFEPAPLNHDGTVDDTADVKHAKAILHKAHNEAKARLPYPKYEGPFAPLNHDGSVDETPEVKHAKAVHFQLFNQAIHRRKRSPRFVPAPLNSDGTVDDTDEVKHAKAAFLAAHASEFAHADHSWVEPEYYEPMYHHYAEPIQFHPATTFEVPHQPMAHYIALQTYPKYFIPAPLNHDGTVADTQDIKDAKAIHFAAHHEAHSRILPHLYSHPHF